MQLSLLQVESELEELKIRDLEQQRKIRELQDMGLGSAVEQQAVRMLDRAVNTDLSLPDLQLWKEKMLAGQVRFPASCLCCVW